MPEPLSGATFLVGILGNLLARHIDPASRSAAEAILSRLAKGQQNIPPNHDLERACRLSLRGALEFMAQAMDLHVSQPKTLKEGIKNRFDAHGNWKPLIDWWHTEEKEWFVRMNENIASDQALSNFDLNWVKGATSLNDPLRSQENPHLIKHFGDALIAWVDRHVTCGKPPAFFAEWAMKGWPVAKDSPNVRINLYSVWCLFLQHHFKEDEKVKAILTADWLASIDERLRESAICAKELTEALLEPHGDQLKMLAELQEDVQTLANSFPILQENTSQLIALVLEFHNEVGLEFSNLRRILADEHEAVVQRLDISLSYNKQILDKVNHLLAETESQFLCEQSVLGGETLSKRIADSKLLASDGASRFKKLIGRAQEKSLLTRAWHDDRCQVLSFVAWGGAGKTSLVVDWLMKNFIEQGWPEVDAFFDWTFYSQGTRDHTHANSEVFFNKALSHFGEITMAESNTSVEEKATRLVAAMAKQRTMLILDGLEPLQHPRRIGQEEGRLKDNGIATLLRLLAQSQSPGLCIITSRLPVIDLRCFNQRIVSEVPLNHLSVRFGAELLHLAGARFAGAASIDVTDKELRATVISLKGHAMTLQMLGGYLRTVKNGDILRRDCIDFKRVFEDQLEGHTYNVMAAYEEWFKAEGPRGLAQLSVLRMLGLFDRVANAGCILALRQKGGIVGVSDQVASLSENDWQKTLNHLSEKKLVFVDRCTQDLDAHPLLREYFAQRLQNEQPDAWKAGHERLYEYLCTSTLEGDSPTLEDLQPLYQAVAHGCHANLGNVVFSDVLWPRILQGDRQYSWKALGAIASDLSAIASFFELPWGKPRPNLSKELLTYIFGASGFYLQCLLRFEEAESPMKEALRQCIEINDWKFGSRAASNLCEMYLIQGLIQSAISHARNAVRLADIANDDFFATYSRSALGESLFLSGDFQHAKKQFKIAESLHLQSNEFGVTSSPTLVGVQGYRQCKYELGVLDRSLWRYVLEMPQNMAMETIHESLLRIESIAHSSLEFVKTQNNLLNEYQVKLILILVWSYRKFINNSVKVTNNDTAVYTYDSVVEGIRRASLSGPFVEALLYRAQANGWLLDKRGARHNLDKAWDIVVRGPMKLHLADIHLHRARLFFREKSYPWESPAVDIAAAEKLIKDCGYHRRKHELADAKRVILDA